MGLKNIQIGSFCLGTQKIKKGKVMQCSNEKCKFRPL
jgi:hypothetical protein